MSYEAFTFDVADKVAHVTLNRPEVSNAMNKAFWREIREIFAEIDQRGDIRAVIISGAGKHFTSGLDLSLFSEIGTTDLEPARRGEALRRQVLQFQESFNVIDRCRIPVLTAIHGACIGGGMDLITATDMRYCTRDAYFSIHETNIGMTADVGTLQRAPKSIPDGIVRELAYTGRRWSALEAKEAHFINQLYDTKEEMMAAVQEIAEMIAAKSPIAVTGSKEMLNYARDHSIADGLNYIATWNASMLSQAELMEGLKSQMEKRPARYEDLHTPEKDAG